MSKGGSKNKRKVNSKKKGVVYVAQRLQKYYKSDYSKSDVLDSKQLRDKARNRAKDIIAELKEKGEVVNWKNARAVEKAYRTSRLDSSKVDRGVEPSDKPVFPDELIASKNEILYFDAEPIVLRIIEASDSRIYYVSDFFEEAFVGGEELNYYSSGWRNIVSQLDKIRKKGEYFYFVFGNIYFNKFSKRFESRISIVDDGYNDVQVETFSKDGGVEFKASEKRKDKKKEIDEGIAQGKESASSTSEIDKEIELSNARAKEAEANERLQRARTDDAIKRAEKALELAKAGFSKSEIMRILGI
jgi:hypothetical protein